MTGPEPGPGARRGDLVILHVRKRAWAALDPSRLDDEFWAGEAMSVTRGGQVRRYRPAGRFAWHQAPGAPPYRGEPPGRAGLARYWVASAREIDVTGALATAACHAWPGSGDLARYYDTLEEMQEALQPHRLEQPGWQQLRDAALAWEEALRAARPLLSTALRLQGEEFQRASAAYHEAVTAASSAYRRQ